jgi:hypothetical protein
MPDPLQVRARRAEELDVGPGLLDRLTKGGHLPKRSSIKSKRGAYHTAEAVEAALQACKCSTSPLLPQTPCQSTPCLIRHNTPADVQKMGGKSVEVVALVKAMEEDLWVRKRAPGQTGGTVPVDYTATLARLARYLPASPVRTSTTLLPGGDILLALSSEKNLPSWRDAYKATGINQSAAKDAHKIIDECKTLLWNR